MTNSFPTVYGFRSSQYTRLAGGVRGSHGAMCRIGDAHSSEPIVFIFSSWVRFNYCLVCVMWTRKCLCNYWSDSFWQPIYNTDLGNIYLSGHSYIKTSQKTQKSSPRHAFSVNKHNRLRNITPAVAGTHAVRLEYILSETDAKNVVVELNFVTKRVIFSEPNSSYVNPIRVETC